MGEFSISLSAYIKLLCFLVVGIILWWENLDGISAEEESPPLQSHQRPAITNWFCTGSTHWWQPSLWNTETKSLSPSLKCCVQELLEMSEVSLCLLSSSVPQVVLGWFVLCLLGRIRMEGWPWGDNLWVWHQTYLLGGGELVSPLDLKIFLSFRAVHAMALNCPYLRLWFHLETCLVEQLAASAKSSFVLPAAGRWDSQWEWSYVCSC